MENIEVTFPKLNHFWLDSGLLGLSVLLGETDNKIKKTVNDNGLTLAGTEEDIKAALNGAYDLLISRCYDTSTKKQREEMSGFFFDSSTKSIKRFPKKQLSGVAALLYGENQIFQYDKGIKWDDKTTHRLPNENADIQSVLDEFMGTTGIKPSTSMLILDSPYQLKPKLDPIELKGKPRKEDCFLCGNTVTGKAKEITKGAYPFITSSSGFKSFNSMARSAEKVCWKCDYLTKFVPINSFHLATKIGKQEDLFVFFPYSISFLKMFDAYQPLQDAKHEDLNLYKNFQHPLGFESCADGFFQKPFEVTFAFLYTLYRKVLLINKADEKEGLDWDKMCGFITSESPLEFMILHAESKGQTYMGKMLWPFRDSVYFFRLMESLEGSGINIKEVMRRLIDFSQKNANRTLHRNKICERILKKQSVLDLIESHVFSSDVTFIKPLANFVVRYEPAIRKEEQTMIMDAQDAAVTLGKRIGMTVGENGKKGDLFALRKARRKTDFLNEINRLQFKCRLIVPPDLYKVLTDINFVEFKQFCMIAALNSFYAATQSNKGGVI